MMEDIAPTNLWFYIRRFDWANARCYALPQEMSYRCPDYGNTTLHLLCSIGSAPYDLISTVYRHAPANAWVINNRGDTPLHIVCRNNQYSSGVVKLLTSSSSLSFSIRNKYGELPIHTAYVSNISYNALILLMKANPSSLLLRNKLRDEIPLGLLWMSFKGNIHGATAIDFAIKSGNISNDSRLGRVWDKMAALAYETYKVIVSAEKEKKLDASRREKKQKEDAKMHTDSKSHSLYLTHASSWYRSGATAINKKPLLEQIRSKREIPGDENGDKDDSPKDYKLLATDEFVPEKPAINTFALLEQIRSNGKNPVNISEDTNGGLYKNDVLAEDEPTSYKKYDKHRPNMGQTEYTESHKTNKRWAEPCDKRNTHLSEIVRKALKLKEAKEDIVITSIGDPNSSTAVAIMNRNVTLHDSIRSRELLVHAIVTVANYGCPLIDFLKLSLKLYPRLCRVLDEDGNTPLHLAVAGPRDTTSSARNGNSIVDVLLKIFPRAARMPNKNGRLPLNIAVESGNRTMEQIRGLVSAAPEALCTRDMATHLFPFMLSALSKNSDHTTDLSFQLLQSQPEVVRWGIPCNHDGETTI